MQTKIKSLVALSTTSILVATYLLSSARLSKLILRMNEMTSTKRRNVTHPSISHQVLADWTRPSTCPPLAPRNITSARIEPLLALNYSVPQAFQHLLSWYIAWHKAVALRGPSACTRILVWTCDPGVGLGDQVRGAHHALMLAMETERYLVLDPPPHASIYNALEPSRINWRPQNTTKHGAVLFLDIWRLRKLPQLTSASVFEKMYGDRQVVRLSSHALPEYESLVNTTWAHKNCQGNGNPHRCRYGSPENIEVNRLAHKALFQYKQVDLRKAHMLSSSLGLRPGKYAAIHARVGGKLDTTEAGRFKKINELLDIYERKLPNCVKKVAPGIRKVYVASDDESFKKRVVAELISKNMTSLPSPIIARHTRNGLKWSANKEQVVRNSTAESLVMGDAQVLITTGSGFSFLAAFGGHSRLVNVNEC